MTPMRFSYDELVRAGEKSEWDVRSITPAEYEGMKNYPLDVALNILKKRRKSSYARRRVVEKPATGRNVRIVREKDESDYGCHFPEICSPQQWPCEFRGRSIVILLEQSR
jgi:hypothetical protein